MRKMSADSNLESKHSYVTNWLERVFSGSPIPDYEINPNTVEELYTLAHESEESERRAEVLIKEMEQRIETYEAETSKLQSLHEMIGVTFDHLSPETKDQIEVLASTANTLNITDCSSAGMSLGLSKLLRDQASLEVDSQRLSKEITKVEKAIAIAIEEKQKITGLTGEVRSKEKGLGQRLAGWRKEGKFLEQKSQQYQKLISTLETQLKESGYSSEIKHSQLEEKYQGIRSLEEKIAPLKSKLSHYRNLPPDMELARLKVEETRAELLKLEKQLSQNIDLIGAEN